MKQVDFFTTSDYIKINTQIMKLQVTWGSKVPNGRAGEEASIGQIRAEKHHK